MLLIALDSFYRVNNVQLLIELLDSFGQGLSLRLVFGNVRFILLDSLFEFFCLLLQLSLPCIIFFHDTVILNPQFIVFMLQCLVSVLLWFYILFNDLLDRNDLFDNLLYVNRSIYVNRLNFNLVFRLLLVLYLNLKLGDFIIQLQNLSSTSRMCLLYLIFL